ncbi:MAG: ATP-binding protein, partial [Candidatus Binatia bacterium]
DEVPAAPSPPRTISSMLIRRPYFNALAEEAPIPIVFADRAGELVFANRLARAEFFSGQEAPVSGKISDLLDAVVGAPNFFRPKGGGDEAPVYELIVRPFADDPVGMAYYFLNRTRERSLESEVDRLDSDLTRYQAQAQLAAELVHNTGNSLLSVSMQEQIIERILARGVTPAEFPGGEAIAGTGPSRMAVVRSRIRDLGANLAKVVEDFRTSRRILGGSREIKILALEEVVAHAVQRNQAMRERYGVRMTAQNDPVELLLRGEEATLIHAVLNLLVNACHAMPQGGELTVGTRREGAFGVIEIRDSGVGIAPENLPKIFNLGFTTRAFEGGTGEGLHSVKQTVERIHGGRVEVESELDVGTLFRLYLPLVSTWRPPAP